MTAFLLDENVLREKRPGGHANVLHWLAGVDDSELRLSVVTLFEKRRGSQKLWPRDPARAEAILKGIEALETAYRGRIIPIDAAVAAEWARLAGASDKNRLDLALAATARIHGFVLVTRNIRDFQSRGVRLLDPFRNPAVVINP